MRALAIFLLAVGGTFTHGFSLPAQSTFTRAQKPHVANVVPIGASLQQLRGGNVHASAAAALAGGAALPLTTGIAAAAGLLAFIRQAYIFSLSCHDRRDPNPNLSLVL